MSNTLANPVTARLVIEAPLGDIERYDITISPFEGAHVLLRVHGPVPGRQAMRLQVWPNRWHVPVHGCALLALLEWFFGDTQPSPRIVGAPEWASVSLELCSGREGHMRRLVHWEMRTLGEGRRASLTRQSGAKNPVRSEVLLAPEDADGILALARHAMPAQAAPASVPDSSRVGQRHGSATFAPGGASEPLAQAA